MKGRHYTERPIQNTCLIWASLSGIGRYWYTALYLQNNSQISLNKVLTFESLCCPRCLVFIRMHLQSQFSVGLLQVTLGAFFLDFQHFIVVLTPLHSAHPKLQTHSVIIFMKMSNVEQLIFIYIYFFLKVSSGYTIPCPVQCMSSMPEGHSVNELPFFF